MCRHVFASAVCVAAAVPWCAFAAADAPRPPVSVTVTADGCQPSALTVPPGRSTFRITNASAQPVGWVILNGTMAIDPRAKIVPV